MIYLLICYLGVDVDLVDGGYRRVFLSRIIILLLLDLYFISVFV